MAARAISRNRPDQKMHDREEQLGFQLGGDDHHGAGQPKLGEIREDLEAILAEARGASDEAMWNPSTLRFKKIVFLQLAKLLPEDESEQLRFDFLEECGRIEALLAA